MAVFVILLFVPIVIQHFTVGKRNVNFEKKNSVALAFFFLFFAFLVMFRHKTVGVDTPNYIYFFNNFSYMSWADVGKHSLEIGFSYFNKLISTFTSDPQVFFAITALITLIMIYPTYKRLSLDPSLTIVLFCVMSTFGMMFSGIRQMIAVGIGFIAYECTRRKKLIPFIICVVVAMTFHTSAFMLAFMYPIYRAKITKKWLIAIVPLMGIVMLFNQQIFSALSFLIERYTTYDATIEQTGAYTMILLFMAFAVFAFLIPDEDKIDEETIGLRNFLLFSLVLQMFAPLHTIAMRMNYYYIIFIPLLLPKIIEHKNEKWAQVATIARHVMVVFFLAYFFINATTNTGILRVFPYHFFWESI